MRSVCVLDCVGITTTPPALSNTIHIDNQKSLAYGENMYRAHNTAYSSIHAEHNAILNLPTLPKKHHLKKVDMIVIRTSKTGNLGMSRPCLNCLLRMRYMAPEKGYRVCNIIYSDTHGDVITSTLEKLLMDDSVCMSSFYRNSNFQLRCFR